jgi:hypothetical protein
VDAPDLPLSRDWNLPKEVRESSINVCLDYEWFIWKNW